MKSIGEQNQELGIGNWSMLMSATASERCSLIVFIVKV